MTIALTGAAGQLGRLVTEHLLASADPSDIVMVTRRPEAVADLTGRGATVRHADFTQPDTVAEALTGIDRLLIISTDDVATRLPGQLAAVAAAQQAGVGHLFYTSVTKPVATNPAGVVPSHRATEQALADSGLRWTALRNNLYSEFQVPTIQQAAATGRIVSNAGPGLTSYVSRVDCAAAAAAALLLPDPAEVYDISGPVGVSVRDLAELAAGLRGGPVDVVDVSDEAYAAGLVAAGVPEPAATLLTSFGAATREGFLDLTTATVRELTGQDPTPVAALLG